MYCVPSNKVQISLSYTEPVLSSRAGWLQTWTISSGICLVSFSNTSLVRLTPGKDITTLESERASYGAYAVLRKIRDSLVLHGDYASRNAVRPGNLDHPVMVEFGNAVTNMLSSIAPKA